MFRDKKKGENQVMSYELPDNIIYNREKIEDHKRKVREIVDDLLHSDTRIKCVRIKTPIYNFSYNQQYPQAVYQSAPLCAFTVVEKEDFIEIVSLSDHHVPYYEIIPDARTGQYGMQCTTTFYCIDKYPIHTKILSLWTIDTALLPTLQIKNY